MSFIAENCKYNMKVINKAIESTLFEDLKSFAGNYNHCFRPKFSEYDKKYAIVYHNDDLKLMDYIGEDVYSKIWFDDKATARLAMELFRDRLIDFFEKSTRHKTIPLEKIFETYRDSTYICSVCGNVIFPDITFEGEKVNITTTTCDLLGGMRNGILKKNVCESCKKKIGL